MVGRPTKLTKATIVKGREYLELCETDRKRLPTIEGLAIALEISRETVYDWEENSGDEAFSDIVRKLRASQGEKLIQLGLNGTYNPTIAKLILSGKHGYVEKSALENSGEQKVTVEITKYERKD